MIYREKIYKIIRYLISGCTAAVANLSSMYLFTDIFGFWYMYSAVLAFSVAFFVSFLLQKYWTFKEISVKKVHTQISLYLLVGILNLVCNALLLYVFVDILHMWYMTGQFLVSGMIAVWSFFIYRKFIFNQDQFASLFRGS